MVSDSDYQLQPGNRVAVYTWGGCTLQVRGQVHLEYESANHAMKEYINVSSIFDAMREIAAAGGGVGPRVLVTGAPSSGKSSLCQILTNYAMRRGWSPMFVELDPRGSSDKMPLEFMPGLLGAAVAASVEQEPLKDKVAYFFGHSHVGDNPKLFSKLSEYLSEAVCARLRENLKAVNGQRRRDEEALDAVRLIAASGLVVNAPQQSTSTDELGKIIRDFGINVVLVVDDPSMKNLLCEKYNYVEPETEGDVASPQTPEPAVRVLSLPKAEGVVAVGSDRVRQLNRHMWQRYFCEVTASVPQFSPPVVRVKLSQFKLVTLEVSDMPVSALPAGKEQISSHDVRACAFTGAPTSLANAIIALSASKNADEVAWSPVACFVHIRRVEPVGGPDGSAVDWILDMSAPSLGFGTTGLVSDVGIVPGRQMRWQPDM